EPKLASLAEKVRPDLDLLKVGKENTVRATGEQSLQVRFAHGQGQASQIVAIQRDDIERKQLDAVVFFARMERVEIGIAVDAPDDGFARSLRQRRHLIAQSLMFSFPPVCPPYKPPTTAMWRTSLQPIIRAFARVILPACQ